MTTSGDCAGEPGTCERAVCGVTSIVLRQSREDREGRACNAFSLRLRFCTHGLSIWRRERSRHPLHNHPRERYPLPYPLRERHLWQSGGGQPHERHPDRRYPRSPSRRRLHPHGCGRFQRRSLRHQACPSIQRWRGSSRSCARRTG